MLSLFSFQCERGWLKELLNPTVEGCTISSACNYNPDANKFDGNCDYSSCYDCLGQQHGVATMDSCGTCDAEPSTDCVMGCDGIWGSGKSLDCNDICNGTNYMDNCNVCDADMDNDCEADCTGTWGGAATKDQCNVCNGDGNSCLDCNGDLDGNAYLDGCSICVGGTTDLTPCPTDCAGLPDGTSIYDQCGICVLPDDATCTQGCDGNWVNDGTQLVLDECLVCGGNNSTCNLAPGSFSYNQSSNQAFYVAAIVLDHEGEILTNGDWIGAFNGEKCVGSRKWDSQCNASICDIPVMGVDTTENTLGYMQEGDYPTFKVWDASEESIHDAFAAENFSFQEGGLYVMSKISVYVDCSGEIGGDAVIDNCGVCEGNNDCEGQDCSFDNSSSYCQDLDVLQMLIDQNENINLDMDDNGDGIIEPLELGIQEWENGRLVKLDCHWWERPVFGDCHLIEIPLEIGNLLELRSLDLSGNNIIDIPSEIGNLANLNYLYLDDNDLIEIPSSVWNLLELETLSLSDNKITEIPSEIGNLLELQWLNLSNNNIEGEIPSSIGNLLELKWLNLNDNDLTGIPSSISNLSELETLSLMQNNLTDIPSSIGNLSELETLNLMHNDLTEIPSFVWNLLELKTLNLSDNNIEGEIPSSIGNLLELEWLYLSNNNFTLNIPATMWNLQNLIYLSLFNNNLSGEIPSEIGNLLELQWLNLNSNNLTGEIPSEIGNLQDLHVLSLAENKFTGEIPSSMGYLDNLGYLYLNNNEFSGLPESFCNLVNIPVLDLNHNLMCEPYLDCLSEDQIGWQNGCLEDCGEYECESVVNLSIENVDMDGTVGTLDLYMENSVFTDGFQIEMTGMDIIQFMGGSAASNGLVIMSDASTIIGYSMSQTSIPAGEGVLITLVFENYLGGDICLIHNVCCRYGQSEVCPYDVHSNGEFGASDDAPVFTQTDPSNQNVQQLCTSVGACYSPTK